MPVAPGLAGAAAVTSALASFGPGGMVGGLLTAGALVSAGSGTIAVGMMTAGSTAEEFEGVIQSQLARLILRETWGMSRDESVWHVWTELERDLIRQRSKLERFSDKNAPRLKDTDRKLATVRKAIHYAEEKGLSPQTS